MKYSSLHFHRLVHVNHNLNIDIITSNDIAATIDFIGYSIDFIAVSFVDDILGALDTVIEAIVDVTSINDGIVALCRIVLVYHLFLVVFH